MRHRHLAVAVVLIAAGCGGNVDWLRLCTEGVSTTICITQCAACLSEHRDPVELAAEPCAAACAGCLGDAVDFVAEIAGADTGGAACPLQD
jgi:hypothetical protein